MATLSPPRYRTNTNSFGGNNGTMIINNLRTSSENIMNNNPNLATYPLSRSNGIGTNSSKRLPFTIFHDNKSPEPESVTIRKRPKISKRSSNDHHQITSSGEENDSDSNRSKSQESVETTILTASLPGQDEGNILASDVTNENFEPISYPQDIELPPSGLLKALYEDILKQEDEEIEQWHDSDDQSLDVTRYDQTYLNDAEILSFEKIILPAIAYQEEQSLKKVQARIQRDRPELKPILVHCRKFVYNSLGCSIIACEKSRLQRTHRNKEAEERWNQQDATRIAEEERRIAEEKARRKAERAKLRELQRLKKQRELKKKHPTNLEIWKEVAFLMSELTHLQQDETKWEQALKELNRREQELTNQEAIIEQKEQTVEDGNENEEASSKNPSESYDIERVTKCIQDIILSTTQIEEGLKVVKDVVVNVESTRKGIYQEYTEHHQFHGYQGIHNPKGLLFALSQSQDDSEW